MNGPGASAAHPKLSRETRRLLAAAVLALVALLILARIRFPERAESPGPIPPLLAQLSPRSSLATIAEDLARVQQRVSPAITVLRGTLGDGAPRAVLRIGADTAITHLTALERRGRTTGGDVLALDSLTGLTIVRVDRKEPGPPPTTWSPAEVQAAKFLAVADVLDDRVSLRPVFVGAFASVYTTGWSDRLWQIPASAELSNGALLFTDDGELAGLVVREGTSTVLVPGETLLFDAQRLLHLPSSAPADLGISVRPLTPSLAAASGSRQGVVVLSVDARARGRRLAPGDVIARVNGEVVNTRQEWEERTGRIAPGDSVELVVWREGTSRQVTLTTTGSETRQPAADLGLSLRWVSALGSEVVHVTPRSAGEAAGLAAGDIITSMGASASPTPSQLQAAFTRVDRGRALVIGFLRAGTPDVVAVVKP